MNLLDRAEADNAKILEDTVNGFGQSMTYTLAEGGSFTIAGQYIRRGTKIDLATGLPVAADEAAVTVRVSTWQTAARLLVPAREKPLEGDKIDVADSTGTVIHYRVPKDSLMADRTAGRFTLVNLKAVS